MTDPSPRTSRPRVADHASLRQHVRGDEAWVVVHDTATGSLLQLGPREAAVLLAADGTRDHLGIALAARRRGVNVSERAVAKMFASLADRGLVEDGPPAHDPEVATLGALGTGAPTGRYVRTLPGHTFACDGRGSCCKHYDAVLFTPSDRARALAAYAGERVGPWPIEHAFVPEFGSAPSPVKVATAREDGCMFLRTDGRCGVHHRAGLTAKPSGCQSFPARFVDDGDVVRATVLTECRCALARPPADAAALVPKDTRVSDLPALTVVDRLPDRVHVGASRTWSRAELRSWNATALKASERAEDPARWAWDEAHRLAPDDDQPDRGERFAALAERSARFAALLGKWQRPQAHLRTAAGWTALAAAALCDRAAAAALLDRAPEGIRAERLALRLVLWGFTGLGERSVAEWLRDRAIRLWVARAMVLARSEATAGAAFDEPIATLDALMRGHGLDDYAGLPT